MADVKSLVKALKDMAVTQYGKGAPYRDALASALKGDMAGVNQSLSKSDLTPMDFAMMLGTIKGVNQAPFESALKLAQERAALPYNEGGLNLPPNNTPMQRAKALGYENQPSKEMYHYAREGWESNQIDPSKSDLGFHAGTVEQANNRANVFMPHEEGGNIMPLMKSKYANMLKVNDEGSFRADSLSPQFEKKGLVSKGYTKKIMSDPLGETSPYEWDLRYDQKMRDILGQNDYHGVKYNNAQEGEGTSYAFTDPTMVRSRFAAFDPFRRNENDILAGVGAGVSLPFLDSSKDKKKK